jgi:sugar phosphate isomerase/epimerase
MVYSVEISTWDDSVALAESMKKMREWLDRHKVEPALFRYSTTPPPVVFRVEFADEKQAIAFAEAFGGHLVVGQTSPVDLQSSPVPIHRGREDAYAANSSLFP